MDRFGQTMPWETRETLSQQDWQGEQLVVGCTYYDLDGEYVHEDEILDYIKETYRTVVAEEDAAL